MNHAVITLALATIAGRLTTELFSHNAPSFGVMAGLGIFAIIVVGSFAGRYLVQPATRKVGRILTRR